MDTKDNISKIIHLREKDMIILKEMFYKLLSKPKTNEKKAKSKLIVPIDDMIAVVFGNKNEKKKENESSIYPINNKIKEEIEQYIIKENIKKLKKKKKKKKILLK